MELNKIYNEDCLVGMEGIPNNSIDLVVTSPPYDDLRTYNGYVFDFEQIADELYRILKVGGTIVWIVSDATIKGSETGTSFKQALYFKEIGFNLHDTMIYLKDNPPPVGGNNRYYQTFEYMFVFTKGKPKTFNPIIVERRNKYNDKRTERTRSVTRDKDGNFGSKKRIKINTHVKKRNVWKYVVGGGNITENKKNYNHPAMFPYQLAKDCVLSWSNEEDIVLDTFIGSGTTAIACIDTNRKYIGFEISEEYCELANERIEKHNKQMELFENQE
ncbi:site-specific DNA-methyltransferase [Staphylococcus haemolyticus]|uniref:DNA-methyltransferase n=1 Tax=Staphylococcus haemolyticus TaxID=1283 RepID=UPI0030C2D328